MSAPHRSTICQTPTTSPPQAAKEPQCAEAGDAARVALLVSPDMEDSELGEQLDHPQVHGFKVYHVYADRRPTCQAFISEFVPEWAWRIADERGWFLMLPHQ